MITCDKIMNNVPLTVRPTLGVRELAELFLTKSVESACVVDQESLVGVVTSMDLVFQEKQIHLPTFVHFLNGLLPLEPFSDRTRKELDKVAGATVAEIMTRRPVTVRPDTPVSEAATLMVERHLSILPVVENGRLLGAVTKPSLLRHYIEHS
ncbi:MAG: CBS domain-containing protein [Myxococcales bacterium]|nr:CBS domain-containing protein [Myxococcales bacterium]